MMHKKIILLTVLVLSLIILGAVLMYRDDQKIFSNNITNNNTNNNTINALGVQQTKNIQFKTIAGVDNSFLQLDVYPLENVKNAPVVIFVHGGGWTAGDKGEVKNGLEFVNFFQRNNTVFVSTNYRLLFNDKAKGTTHADQLADIASAVKWVRDNIVLYGGDPENISIFGHSSGAHTVALLGTDEKYLKAEGLNLDVLNGVISFDVAAYDIPRAIVEAAEYNYPQATIKLPKFFTSNIETQKDASPMHHIYLGTKYPPFLVVYAGIQQGGVVQQLSKRQSELFVDALLKVGAGATLYGDSNLTHSQIVSKFGVTNFGPTQAVQKFLYNK